MQFYELSIVVCENYGTKVLLQEPTAAAAVAVAAIDTTTTDALVAVWQSAGFAIGRLQVRISNQGLLSLPSLRGR